MKKYLASEKVSVWAYDKYDERKDLFLSGTLAECNAIAEKYSYIVFDVYCDNKQASFDYTVKQWYINE